MYICIYVLYIYICVYIYIYIYIYIYQSLVSCITYKLCKFKLNCSGFSNNLLNKYINLNLMTAAAHVTSSTTAATLKTIITAAE